MRLFIILLFIALFSCTSKKGDDTQSDLVTKETARPATTIQETVVEDTIVSNKGGEEKEEAAGQNEDCIFDNDYRTVTAEWLAEQGIPDFIWDERNKRAVITVQTDTVYATVGGCSHFGITAGQEFRSSDIALSDSAYWINHALRLAKLFHFDFYASEIEEGNFTLEENGPTEVWFIFGDDDSSDNLIYNGIEVKQGVGLKVVSLSQYFN